MNGASESQEEASSRNGILNTRTKLKVGCWNVRTMYETGKQAQILNEMKNYKLHLLGISECRWTGCGKSIARSGETIIHSGRTDNKHQQGVAIIMNKQTAKSLIEYNPVNERIIRARFHAKKGKVTFIQCYAPTNEAEEEVKTEFYNTLQAEIRKVPTHDLTIVMGDLNAKVGNDNTGNERVMGKYGCGQMNENGELLVDFCGINNLVIGGTIFPHKDIHKLTWNSPNGRDKNQIDHIMINGKWKRSLQDVRVKRGADIASDHFLITANIKLKLKKMSSPTTIKRKFDINKLQDTKVKQEFNLQIKNRFQVLEDTIEETSEPASINNKWLKVEEIYKETSEKVLGYKRQIHKEWITQGTWKLIDERKEINNKLCQTYSERIKDKLRKEYSECNKKVKKATRSDKRKYTEDLAKEAENAASNQRMGQVYQVVKQLCNKKTNKSMPIKDKQNNTLSSEKEQKERWKEHFQEVLNRKEPENTVSIDITETPLELDIDLYAPTKLEIQRALKSLRNRKAPGIDQLNAELFKADVKQTSDILYPVFKEIWENNIIPDNWSEGDIIRIPKKGDLTNCNNWRGITLLSIPSKVFCKILISRIKTAIDRTLRQEQAGFRQGRSCIDHIFVLRNILEQCAEWQRKIIINFVDFEKAFDSLHRQGLWTILKSYGIPEKIIQLIKAFYDNFKCTVDSDPDTSFLVKSGVRQGCVMSSLLFIIAVDWVMKSTMSNTNNGIRWTLTSNLEDIDYADDLALVSHTENQMKEKTERLEQNARMIGLKINSKKTQIMTVNMLNTPDIKVNGEQLELVQSFTYLGSVVTSEGGAEQDIKTRIGKARSAFHRLRNIWKTPSIRKKTKLKIYNSCVTSVLLYGAECWRMTEKDINRLSSFHNTCLRRIMKIYWPNKITNEDLHKKTKSQDIETTLLQKRWRWLGHVLRKPQGDMTKVALRWTPEGKRKRGRPKTTWRRTIETEMKERGYTWGTIEKKAENREEWRQLVLALCAKRHNKD